jgi:Leucine-rich repeat (LRR) protein
MALLRNASLIFLLLCLSPLAFSQTENAPDETIYRSLSKALRNAETARKLNLSDKKLKEFPRDILKLKQLRVLILDSNAIASIPDEIATLENLRILSFSHNSLTAIPPALGQLNNLEGLYLDHNQITILPKELFLLTKLERLFLEENKIAELPPAIGTLRELVLFDIGHNQLESVPSEIGKLYNMEQLSMEENKIMSLPTLFFEMSKLQVLYLGGNKLSAIDTSISKLKELESLALDFNQLESIPAQIGTLYKLKQLYLANNKIGVLPEQICDLYNLKTLTLSKNPLTTLPANMDDLKKLEHLYLKDVALNPFPQVLYDMQHNKTQITGLKTNELYTAKLLLSKARNKKLTGNYTEAALRYNELLKVDTNNIEALSELAVCYLESANYDSAAYISKRALMKNPPQNLISELQSTHNKSLNRTNSAAETEKSYASRLERDPSNVLYLYDFGKYYFMQQKYDLALPLFEKAVKVSPSFASAHFYLALNHLAAEQDQAFVFSALRYLTLEQETKKAESILPFIFIRMKMKTGVENKKGSVSYYDSYIVREEDGEIVYKSENSTDLLAAIMSDLTRTNLKADKDDDASEKEVKAFVSKAFYTDKSNPEIFQEELRKLCEMHPDSISAVEKNTFTFYRPFFKSMMESGHLETFSHIVNAIRRDDKASSLWLKNNKVKVEAYKSWLATYKGS